MTSRIAYASLLSALCLLSCGCVRAKLVYYINPDGSGKVSFNMITVDMPSFGIDPSKRQPPKKLADQPGFELEEKIRLRLTKVIQEAKGVSAWRIDKCEFRDDGQLHMIGTAWFDDLSKMKNVIGNISANVTQLDNGNSKFEIVETKPETATASPPDRYADVDLTQATDQQLEDLILLKRVEYRTARGMLAALQDLKVRYVFVFPGQVISSNLTNVQDDTMTFDITGEYLLQLADRHANRDIAELIDEARKTGKLPSLKPPTSGLFDLIGKRPTAIVKNDKPRFDYAAEVKAARAAYPQLIERFKIEVDLLASKDAQSDKATTP